MSMRLAFTTLGCPNWDMDTIIARALEYGFQAVEFRGYLGRMKLPELPEFSNGAPATAARFRAAGIAVPCFGSSAHLFVRNPAEREKSLAEAKAYANLCKPFGARFVRVFGGRMGPTPFEEVLPAAVDALAAMAQAAEELGVEILVETHDDWRGHHLRALMERVARSNVGVLWDISNSTRVGEPPVKIWPEIGRWVKHTHWKDSVESTDRKKDSGLRLMGRGDVPLADALLCLTEAGYAGYLSFEWEKKWAPSIEEPEVAFPSFVEVMKQLMAASEA